MGMSWPVSSDKWKEPSSSLISCMLVLVQLKYRPSLFLYRSYKMRPFKFVIRGCNHTPSSQQLFGNVTRTKLSLSFILIAIAAARDVRGAF